MSQTHTAGPPQQHHITPKTYVIIYLALMGLMALTFGVAYLNLGWANFPIAMGIATVKMVLILLFFMHVRYSDKLTWVYSTAAFLWLVILVIGTLNDYFTRGEIQIPGK